MIAITATTKDGQTGTVSLSMGRVHRQGQKVPWMLSPWTHDHLSGHCAGLNGYCRLSACSRLKETRETTLFKKPAETKKWLLLIPLIFKKIGQIW
jgi:hypothetical protein